MAGLGTGGVITTFIQKYKYALIVLAAGIALMLIPMKPQEAEAPAVKEAAGDTLEDRLSQLISNISGAGRTEVLLTQARGSSILYQTDTDDSQTESSSSNQSRTVIITDAQRNESGLVLRTDPPVYQGAVVVCQGADDPRVRLAIVEAVGCATGLKSNQISVVKMK